MSEKSNGQSFPNCKTLIIYGWFFKENLGDDLFTEAFRFLYPQHHLIFTDHLTLDQLNQSDTVIFGGGSFLLDELSIDSQAKSVLFSKNIYYLGTGIEKEIHPTHQLLMNRAKLIATRSHSQIDVLQQLNQNTIVISDLVFALQPLFKPNPTKKDKSVLIFPNISVVPQYNDPNWKHVAWNYFKSEFGQFVDDLIDQGYSINFFPMCVNSNLSDIGAYHEINNCLAHRDNYLINHPLPKFQYITNLISQYQYVITQRFHGIVLSEICNTPYIALSHHDKLTNQGQFRGSFLSYFGLNKTDLIKSFQSLPNNFSSAMAITQYNFEQIKNLNFGMDINDSIRGDQNQ